MNVTDLPPQNETESSFRIWTGSRHERGGHNGRTKEAESGTDHQPATQGRGGLANGNTTKEVCRDLGVSEQTYYRWRREYGGMKLSQAKRLKELEKENQQLKRAVAELTLDKLILKEASEGNF